MVKVLMIMHHIVLCILGIDLVSGGHHLHLWVDHAEPKSEFQAEQVEWVFGGPQASSCEKANIVVITASPGALTNNPCILL
jgi:hypothetical protein